MRDVINKGLTNEELLRGIKTTVEQGWDKVKLYFMIGLPGETDVDVIGIAETLRWLRRECRLPKRKPLDFTLTISNFTPKPHTPFQWHSVSTTEFIRKQELLRQEFQGMRGVKVNYTDVRISAMEDFIGRGDRSLGKVVLRAWQLGAGMDAWWDNTEKAYQAWSQAIEESGLTWKYRQIEQGEWHIFADADKDILERPLPWDHLDTGIDKKWLQEDLKRALDAATVPDCSFEGCSHCGVCSLDFGHNIVIEVPPIPAFAGHFQPNQERAQRIRVWFGKIGEMALVSHLDLVRLFDRVVRRAAIPISFTGGFHPGPRISIANALSLGATSSGEIVDFELTKVMDLERFKQQLSAQLPADLPVYQVEEIPLNAPAATRLLEKAAYLLTFNSEGIDCQQWQNWIEAIKQATVMEREKTTKSGKKVTINLREQLYELELKTVDKQAVLCYVGSCRNDGTLLQPDHIVEMLERVSGQELSLLNFHRQRLILGA
jgi:radical SAM-linked protein